MHTLNDLGQVVGRGSSLVQASYVLLHCNVGRVRLLAKRNVSQSVAL